MPENKRTIVLNPDRIARQIFPPFRFLLEALLKRDGKVLCISSNKISLSSDCEDCSVITFEKNGKKPSPFIFILSSIQKIFWLCLANKVDSIIVFRCSDCIWHSFSARLGRVPIMFFVDYVPWPDKPSLKMGWRTYFLNPKIGFRVLGFILASEVVFSSESIKNKVCSQLPFLEKKSSIVPYSSDLFEKCTPKEKLTTRKSILSFFPEINSPFLIASTTGYHCGEDIEVCLRAMAGLEDKNSVLALHTDFSDLNYFYSLISGLGLHNRVSIFGSDYDFFDLIASADLLVLPTVGAGVGGYVLNALAQDIPIVANDRGDLLEWIGNSNLLFEKNNTNSLVNLIQGFKNKDKALFSALSSAQEHGRSFSQSWEELAISKIIK